MAQTSFGLRLCLYALILCISGTIAIVIGVYSFSSSKDVYQYPSSPALIRMLFPKLTGRVELSVSENPITVRGIELVKSPETFRETLKFNGTTVVETSHIWQFYFDSSTNITADVSYTDVLPPANRSLKERFELCVLEGKSAYTRWKHHQTGDDIHCTLLETRSSDVLRAFSGKLGARSSIHHNVTNNDIRYVTVRRIDPSDKLYAFSVNVTVERDVVQNTSIVEECLSSWTTPCSFRNENGGESFALQMADQGEHRKPAKVIIKYHPNIGMYVLFFLVIPFFVLLLVEIIYDIKLFSRNHILVFGRPFFSILKENPYDTPEFVPRQSRGSIESSDSSVPPYDKVHKIR